MQTVTLTEAQRHLPELVRGIVQEGELIITEANTPVARLLPVPGPISLWDLRPTSVGALLRPYPAFEDDILDEMLQPAQ